MKDGLKTTIQVKVDNKNLNSAIKNFEGDKLFKGVSKRLKNLKTRIDKTKDPIAESAAQKLTSLIQQFIKSNGNIITRQMYNSVETSGSNATRTVDVTAKSKDGYPYPIGVEKGTKPHIIIGNPYLSFFWKKKNKQMLLGYRFKHGTKPGIVHHPGNRAYPFVEPARKQLKRDVKNIIKGELQL